MAIPGDGEGDEGGEGYEFQEIQRQECHDAAGAGAEYFADADLFDALGDGKGG
jgi:hypothetical protein